MFQVMIRNAVKPNASMLFEESCMFKILVQEDILLKADVASQYTSCLPVGGQHEMEVDAPLSSREVLIDGFTSKITPHSPAMDYQYLGNHGTV